MNLDFHVHGILSKKLNFNPDLFLQGIEYAKENGLDGYILCEHFNAVDLDSTFSYLNDNFNYENDRYIVNGFSIFLGMEVDIKDNGHIIVVGDRGSIAKIRKELEPHIKKSNFIPFEDLLNLGEKYDCLMIGSHPYREKHKLYIQQEHLLKRLHALDLNSKDIYKRGRKIVELEVSTLAKKLGISYVTGSDSHYHIQLGVVKTCFYKECATIKELKEAIKNHEYTIEISNSLSLRVYTAKIAKNSIKKKIKQDRISGFKESNKNK